MSAAHSGLEKRLTAVSRDESDDSFGQAWSPRQSALVDSLLPLNTLVSTTGLQRLPTMMVVRQRSGVRHIGVVQATMASPDQTSASGALPTLLVGKFLELG